MQVHDASIGSVMTAVRESRDPRLENTKWKQTSHSGKFNYRFGSEDQPFTPRRLKIELNTVGSFAFFGDILKRLSRRVTQYTSNFINCTPR